MRIHALLVALICAGSLQARAAAPAEVVKAFNDAATRDQYAAALLSLGFTADDLGDVETQSSGSIQNVSILQKAWFRRAEAFEVDLEGLEGKQTVLQAVFRIVDYKAGFPSGGDKVYFVAVLDSKERGYAVLARKIYDLGLCGPGQESDEKWENAMSFGFKPAPKKKFKQVVFRVSEVDACGLQIQSSEHKDTLAFDGKKLVFTKGKSVSGANINRMDPDVVK